ncbi:MAG: hypothetical protein WD205_13010, partial [Rhodothermales bacterium]
SVISRWQTGAGGRVVLRVAALALLAVLLLVGCEEEVTNAPPVEEPFTLFGVVSPTSDTQAVAVYPIETGVLEPLGPTLDAEVTSRELESGDVRVWRDSVVADGQGSYSHIFWSDFRAEYGASYRIEAVGVDGQASSATVRVPEQVTVDLTDEVTDDGRGRMRLSFRPGPFRFVRLDLTYAVLVASVEAGECPTASPFFSYTYSYVGEETPADGGWDLEVDLGEHRTMMREFARRDAGNPLLLADQTADLGLVALELDVTIGDEAWDLPHGFLDRRILSHPGTLTNVVNGLGFVGGGYRYQTRLFPSTDAIEEAGYYDYMAGRAGCE